MSFRSLRFFLALAALALIPLLGFSAEKDQVLSDHWYTIRVGKDKYGYYNDRMERKQGRLFFQNRVWKLEEDFINEEQLGAFAEPNEALKPLFFNFHSTYRTTETNIDGTVNDKQQLSIRVKRGGQELPVVKKVLPTKTIFSVFFPAWLQMRAAGMKPGASLPFLTILEDNIEENFATVSGRVKMEKPDEFANQSKTRKFMVDYRGVKTLWWLDDKGIAVKIERPEQNMVVERVSEATAKKFLDQK